MLFDGHLLIFSFADYAIDADAIAFSLLQPFDATPVSISLAFFLHYFFAIYFRRHY